MEAGALFGAPSKKVTRVYVATGLWALASPRSGVVFFARRVVPKIPEPG